MWSEEKIWEELENEFPDKKIKNLSSKRALYKAIRSHIGSDYREALSEKSYRFLDDLWVMLEEEFPDKKIVNISKNKKIYHAASTQLGSNYRQILSDHGYTLIKDCGAPSENDVIAKLLKRFPDKNLDGLWATDRNLYDLVRRTLGKEECIDKLIEYDFFWGLCNSSRERTIKDLVKKFPDRIVRGLTNHPGLYKRVRLYLGKGYIGKTLEDNGFTYDPGNKWNTETVIEELWKEYPDGRIKGLTNRGDVYWAVRLHIGDDYRPELKKEGFTFAFESVSNELIREMLKKEFPDGVARNPSSRKLLKFRIDKKFPGVPIKEVVEKFGFRYLLESPSKGVFKISKKQIIDAAKETFPSGLTFKITENEWLYGTMRRRFGNPRGFLKKHGILYVPYGKSGKIIQTDLNDVFEDSIESMVEKICSDYMERGTSGIKGWELLHEGLVMAKSMFMKSLKTDRIETIKSICNQVYSHLVKKNKEFMWREDEIKSKLPSAGDFPEWINPYIEFNVDSWFENKFEWMGDRLKEEFCDYCEEDLMTRGNDTFARFGDLYNFFYDIHPELLLPPTYEIGSLWGHTSKIGRKHQEKEDDD